MARRVKLEHTAPKSERENRPVRIRRYKMFILIVCEDTKTEPAYFESFKKQIPEDTLFLHTVGTGRDPQGVILQTISERNLLKADTLKEIDQVWAVFDIDDANENQTKRQKFEDALQIAESENIRLAYSNEVFELWLLLHLTDVSAEHPIPRNTLYAQLQREIRKNPAYSNYEYNHRKIDPLFLPMMTKLGDESLAIERAETLEQVQRGKKPLTANPCTKVHHLVKELREWIKYYRY